LDGPPFLASSHIGGVDIKNRRKRVRRWHPRTGHFELRFHASNHFKAADGLSDVVPVRFAIDAAQHYHVPMLCSPWFFSTYRGS
jgi:5-hydroxyisourate hydrolase-like protein (transthyretin family)